MNEKSKVEVSSSKRIDQIEVIKLPLNLKGFAAISSEILFDEPPHEYRDTVYPNFDNYKFVLGHRLKDCNFIDIRTKVIFKYTNGTEQKYFLDAAGKVMCNNKIYEGSYEQMLILRCEEGEK